MLKNTERGLRAEADAKERTATVYLYDVIGADFFGGITSKALIDAVTALGPLDELNVRINSPGGDVFEGIAIYNFLSRLPARVITHVDSLAASMASVIMLAGERVEIAENAMIMVHLPSMIVWGNSNDMRQGATLLDKVWSSMLATYSRRTGKRGETITQKIDDAGGEWWMTAEEAEKAGFVDEVVAPEQVNGVLALRSFQKTPARLAAAATIVGPEHPPCGEFETKLLAARVEKLLCNFAKATDADIAREQRRRHCDVFDLT